MQLSVSRQKKKETTSERRSVKKRKIDRSKLQLAANAYLVHLVPPSRLSWLIEANCDDHPSYDFIRLLDVRESRSVSKKKKKKTEKNETKFTER